METDQVFLQASWKKFFSWIVSPLLAICSLVTTLCVAEITVRVLQLAPRVYRLNVRESTSAFEISKNPLLGYELKKNFRSASPNYHESFPYINAHGQRDLEREIHKPVEEKRILILGDSVVAGHGIPKIDWTIPRRLERFYRGTKTEVLNFGVGGYCTLAEMELLKTKGVSFSPDLVNLIFVDNDYVDTNSNIFSRVHFERVELLNTLFLRSALFRLLALRWNLFGFKDEIFPEDHFERNKKAIGGNNVEKGISMFSELARENNFRAMIAIWPWFSETKISDERHFTIPENNQRLLIEEYAERFSIPTVRLSKLFQEDYQMRLKKGFRSETDTPRALYTTGDGTHPNKLGAEVAAKAIKSFIEDQKLLVAHDH